MYWDLLQIVCTVLFLTNFGKISIHLESITSSRQHILNELTRYWKYLNTFFLLHYWLPQLLTQQSPPDQKASTSHFLIFLIFCSWQHDIWLSCEARIICEESDPKSDRHVPLPPNPRNLRMTRSSGWDECNLCRATTWGCPWCSWGSSICKTSAVVLYVKYVTHEQVHVA